MGMSTRLLVGRVLNEGYVASGIHTEALKHQSLTAWKQAYHKPYALDWTEACAKAYERLNSKGVEE